MSGNNKDAFRNVSQKPGLQIWTINVSQIKYHTAEVGFFSECVVSMNVFFLLQNMEMVPVPAQAFGNFFEGDCYIVLSVSAITADFPGGCAESLNEGIGCTRA